MGHLLDLLIMRIPGGPAVQGVLFGLVHSSAVFLGTFGGFWLLLYSGVSYKRAFLWSLALAPFLSAWACFRAALPVFGMPLKGVFIGCLTLGWPAVAGVLWVVSEVLGVVYRPPVMGTDEEYLAHAASIKVLIPVLVDGSLATGWFLIAAPLATLSIYRHHN